MKRSSEIKPTIMVIVSRFPFPLEKGDKLRAYYQIKELSENFNISLVAISDRKIEERSILKLEEYCSSINIIRINFWTKLWNISKCFFLKKPFQVGYFYSYRGHQNIKQILQKDKPKHIYCQLIRVSEYIKNYHSCPKTLDYMDALSASMERRISKATFTDNLLCQTEATGIKLHERHNFNYF